MLRVHSKRWTEDTGPPKSTHNSASGHLALMFTYSDIYARTGIICKHRVPPSFSGGQPYGNRTDSTNWITPRDSNVEMNRGCPQSTRIRTSPVDFEQTLWTSELEPESHLHAAL